MGRYWDKPLIKVESIELDGEIVEGKKCTKCAELKPLPEFSRDRKGLAGRMAKCKKCTALYKRKYYKENSTKEKTRSAIWYAENKERALETCRVYRIKNRDIKASRDKVYRQENAETIANRSRVYRAANKEKISLRKKRWYEDNKDIVEVRNLRRRTRENSLENDITKEELKETWEHFNNSCSLTGSSKNVSIDHVIPLHVGKVGATKGNIIPLRLDLNLSKSTKNIFVWFEQSKDIYNLSERQFDRLINWLAEANGMSANQYKTHVYDCHNDTKEESQ